MGMDVYGRKPKSKVGEYFRANCWSWGPIHRLIEIANNRRLLLPERMLKSFIYNDGAGPKSQKVCDKLADILGWLLDHPEIIQQSGLLEVLEEGEFFSVAFPLKIDSSLVKGDKFVDRSRRGEPGVKSAHETSFGHVREFIVFLRQCGGFQVW